MYILDEAVLNLIRRRHSGKADGRKIEQSLAEAMRAGVDFFREFQERWGWTKHITAEEVYETDQIEEVVALLTQKRPKAAIKPWTLQGPPLDAVGRDIIVEALLRGAVETAQEQGHNRLVNPTMTDIANMVTRAHNKVPVRVADHLAAEGARLLSLTSDTYGDPRTRA